MTERKTTTRLLILGSFLVVAVWFAVGWYYSTLILGPDEPKSPTGQRVLRHTDTTITLATTPKALRPGRWAIQWDGGFGHIGPLVSSNADSVVTRFQLASGTPPGKTSRLAGFARDADPGTWLGFVFETVAVASASGSLPCWFVPGTESTWVVLVHGRAATRAEVLRMLPAYASLGLPCLVVSYRNSPDGPSQGDGSYRLGAEEWRDLEGAVRHARERGANQVVVVGCSMGGAIVLQFLRHSSERSFARAAVLDAPALDWSVIFADEARRRHVPGWITEWGKRVAGVRAGLRWEELSLVRHAPEFTTPMLLFHGDADDTVPLHLSREFAAARPDLVTLHVTPGAGHVESVNVEPEAYAATITRWLLAHGIGAVTP